MKKGDRDTAAPRDAAHGRLTGLYAVLFVLFFLSGFCSLLYQVVWLRMAFAHFGIITPVLSLVVSVFMLGLGIGSFAGGRLAQRWCRGGPSPAFLYAAAEGAIGIGAFVVPVLFDIGRDRLLQAGQADSTQYLFLSALYLVGAILPWCIMMGATFPLMMGFIRRIQPANDSSFSFLYLANVVGAMTGTAVTALALVELFGFRGTYAIAAALNFVIAAISIALGVKFRSIATPQAPPVVTKQNTAETSRSQLQLILFTTGFVSLAMEVVWVRGFTYVLKTTIYAFAMILTSYLLATWIGSLLYRRGLARGKTFSLERQLQWLCLFALLPVLVCDPRINSSAVLTLASIVPFCLGLGYLTPQVIDRYARGNPAGAGLSYGINIAGGIIGPLVAAYLLLPTIGVRASLLLLSLPVFLLFISSVRSSVAPKPQARYAAAGFVVLFVVGIAISRSYDDGTILKSVPHEIRRDHVASVFAYGEGMRKGLLVNGVGITHLTPITKIMAHLPLAVNGKAQNILIICFGMGTTFRSAQSWGIDTTAVELSPSVAQSFGFFFANAPSVLANPKARIVIDDGRRYLMRSGRQFDVITLDPPPPVEAAGSSLLYSTGFYDVVKAHLAPGGILQQWIPGSEEKTLQAVARSLQNSFPYVMAFNSVENEGFHFLASMSPIPKLNPFEFAARLPAGAKADLLEWYPEVSAESMGKAILTREVSLSQILEGSRETQLVTDDRPYNEYFVLRRNGIID